MNMLMPQKKKIATVIMGAMKNKKPDFVQALGDESPSESLVGPEPEEDDSLALEAAAQGMMQAMKVEDAKGFASSLEDFISILMSRQEELPEEV